jgi:hypothetical protein
MTCIKYAFGKGKGLFPFQPAALSSSFAAIMRSKQADYLDKRGLPCAFPANFQAAPQGCGS